jgi:hypothetical protein
LPKRHDLSSILTMGGFKFDASSDLQLINLLLQSLNFGF